MERLNYHHLLYFREVAACGSISKAAVKLRVGQPAISVQLKSLEESLGQKLFERVNRGLVLTEAGRFALQIANEIYQSGNTLMEVMQQKTLTARVPLNLGVLNSVPKNMILKLIRQAHRIRECHVTILENNGEELLRKLGNHSLDLLITNYCAPFSSQGDVFSRSLGKSKIAVFGAPRYKALRKNFPKSLEGQLMVTPTNDSQLRIDINRYFRDHNLHVGFFAETQDTSVQKLIAAEGFALVALPEFSAREMLREKKLIKIGTLEDVWEEFWLISDKRMIANPVVVGLSRDFQFSFSEKISK